MGWTWRTSIPLATHQFPRSPHTFCAFCPVSSLLLLWTVLLGPHQDFWLCNLLSDGWHEQTLKEVVEALAPNILVLFPSSSRYKSFHQSAICAASVKFSPVADWIPCRRGWNFLVIDLTIWKSFLEFPFEFAASNSTHMPSSCCCLSTLSFLCTAAFGSYLWLLPDCCISRMRHPFLFLLWIDGSQGSKTKYVRCYGLIFHSIC